MENARVDCNLTQAAFDSIILENIVADSTYDAQLKKTELDALSTSDELCEQIIIEANDQAHWSQLTAG